MGKSSRALVLALALFATDAAAWALPPFFTSSEKAQTKQTKKKSLRAHEVYDASGSDSSGWSVPASTAPDVPTSYSGELGVASPLRRLHQPTSYGGGGKPKPTPVPAPVTPPVSVPTAPAPVPNADIHKVLDMTENTELQTRSSTLFTYNYCEGAKPTDDAFNNFDCADAVINAVEQSGANVTKGYVGAINNSATPPITTSYLKAGLCPVNVHWHLGAEHLSVGEYDEHGSGPEDDYALTDDDHRRRQLAEGGVRLGYQCRHYDADDAKFTKAYDWEHCVDMKVGQTYEVHWPHSTVGACGTPYQYQTPFYDGVFCELGDGSAIVSGAATAHNNVGVQSQTFTIVNDEDYYYPDLLKGAIVSGSDPNLDYWTDVAIYTGSTTGTTRNNDDACSAYSPITWQVDRKCHLISASSFDKLCADMTAQVDDMADDLYAHGSRKLVSNALASAQEV